jgi:hypothetical protein
MKIAFVASVYNEVNDIKLQLIDKNITNIDVFEYGSKPDSDVYGITQYNVRPDKTHGEILDLAQCISQHGFPDDIYVPPIKTIISEDNKILIDKATRHLRLENLEVTLNDNGNTEVTRKSYQMKIQEIMSNDTKLSDMTTHELSKKMMLEQDPVVIIAIIVVLFDKIHNIPMENRYGQPSRGYIAKNGKPIIDYVNANSIGWISELWSELLPKQDEYRQRKYLKALRTRGKNMLKEKASVWGLRFLIEFLIENDTQNTIEVIVKETPKENSNNVVIEYEGFNIEEEIPF